MRKLKLRLHVDSLGVWVKIEGFGQRRE